MFALAIQEDGGVPSYQYAQLFFMLPYGIFAVSIITAIFPTMSERAALKDWEGFRNNLAMGMRATLVAIVPCAVLYLMLNREVITLLLEHGFFKSGDTDLLASVLLFFALGLVPYSLDMLLVKSFYSMQDTRTPLFINCFVVAVNMLANYLLFEAMGVKGLALGFTIAYCFSILILGIRAAAPVEAHRRPGHPRDPAEGGRVGGGHGPGGLRLAVPGGRGLRHQRPGWPTSSPWPCRCCWAPPPTSTRHPPCGWASLRPSSAPSCVTCPSGRTAEVGARPAPGRGDRAGAGVKVEQGSLSNRTWEGPGEKGGLA